LPEALLTHCPLISSLFALIFTVGSITAVAVAMESSLSELSRRGQLQRELCSLPLEIIDFVRRRLAAEEACSRWEKEGRAEPLQPWRRKRATNTEAYTHAP
jgi:hypothetical protein